MKKIATLALGVTLLAGCAGPLVGATGTDEASLSVLASVKDGQFRNQAVGFDPYTKSNINHLVFKLYTVDGASESPVVRGGGEVKADLSAALLDQPVTFKSLHHDTTYRIKAFAYKATGEATDDLISTQDSFSYRDVTVGRNLTPGIVSLPVKLINRLFKAEATSSIVVTDGTLINEDEAISQPQQLLITGSGPLFYVNGNLSLLGLYQYRASATEDEVDVIITNNSVIGYRVQDMYNLPAGMISVPVGTTVSIKARAVGGGISLDVLYGPPV